MGIIYFDICAIPLILMILFICYSRKLFKGTANRLFIVVVFLSLFCTIADLGMEVTDNMARPLSDAAKAVCNVSTYFYFLLRNTTPLFIILFLLALTRTTFLLKKDWQKVSFFAPFFLIIILLIQNPFTGFAFQITKNGGYTRGPLMVVFYSIATIYGIVGFLYCIYSRRYLNKYKWGSLLSIYVLNYISVGIQFFFPDLLIEMFCTAVSEMIILFAIIRPEEQMDLQTGMLSYTTYKVDIKNIIHSRVPATVCIIQIPNCREIRNYLGDIVYDKCLSSIANGIRSIKWNKRLTSEVYFEMPGTIYYITHNSKTGSLEIGNTLLETVKYSVAQYVETGVNFDPKICVVKCPDDLNDADSIDNLGHKFLLISRGDSVSLAGEILSNRNYASTAHIEEIIDNAVKNDGIVMYYQPIYDIKTGKFHSAEALARIDDPTYGIVSPSVFIPAAEKRGGMIILGDIVLEKVFAFMSGIDFEALDLSYIEINLSVAQCMEPSLPDKILNLQKKYNISPERVNLEITETTFSDISDILLENVNKLIDMGYSFALDDYGIGYSSIQRVNRIPFKLIKLDKSLLDDVLSPNGRLIYESTLHMMQNVGKKVVSEGAETKLDVNLLKNMNGDYIQGFYFSKPLRGDDFIAFVKEHNSLQG